jgi:hypothetical protein
VPKPQDPLHRIVHQFTLATLVDAEKYLAVAQAVVSARRAVRKIADQRGPARYATDAEVKASADRMMAKHRPALETLASAPDPGPLPPAEAKRGRGRPVGAIDKAPRVRNRRSRAARPPAASREVDVPLPLPDPTTDEPDAAIEVQP